MVAGGSDGLKLEVTTRPHARLLRAFYAHYSEAFRLPDERESLGGFRTCLALNHEAGDALHARYGASREFIGLLREKDGNVAAGLNFICFPMPQFGTMTVHSIYVFVTEARRRGGLLRKIYNHMEDAARAYGQEAGLAESAALVFFGEQNDPFRMTPATFRADTATAGLNQFDRLRIWGRLGARILLFRYIQPALSERTAADQTLFLRVLFRQVNPPDALDPGLLKEHLRRFFGITVLKGRRTLEACDEVRVQMRQLEALEAAAEGIATRRMPSDEVLEAWKARVSALLEHEGRADWVIGDQVGIRSVPEALAI